jgi:hypothetical protein
MSEDGFLLQAIGLLLQAKNKAEDQAAAISLTLEEIEKTEAQIASAIEAGKVEDQGYRQVASHSEGIVGLVVAGIGATPGATGQMILAVAQANEATLDELSGDAAASETVLTEAQARAQHRTAELRVVQEKVAGMIESLENLIERLQSA